VRVLCDGLCNIGVVHRHVHPTAIMTRNEQQAGAEPRETSPNKGSLADNQLSFMIGYW